MGCQSFENYNETYIICDVLMLADCFETYRRAGIKHYGLDPARYTTAPSYAWGRLHA